MGWIVRTRVSPEPAPVQMGWIVMFEGATSFNQPLNNWDVQYVTDMSGMFSGAISFNQPLNSWNFRDQMNMDEMFEGATSFNIPLYAPWYGNPS